MVMTQEHRSTMRALSIFELLAFGDNSEGYTLTEIVTKLRAPKSSISPIIHTLTTNRYLKYNRRPLRNPELLDKRYYIFYIVSRTGLQIRSYIRPSYGF